MISIAESNETNNDESSNTTFNQSIMESMESPPNTGGTISGISALDKLRNAAKKAAMVKTWSQSHKYDPNDGEEENENRAANNSVVRFKSEDHPPQPTSPRMLQSGQVTDGSKNKKQTAKQSVVGFKSKNEPPQPTSSHSSRIAKKILVKRDSSNVLVNKRDKETARLIASIQREKAKAQEARSKKENKKVKEKVARDEKEVERNRGILKTVRLFDNRPCSQSEPQGSKFFRTIMKRRFGTSGVGYTFSSLLDSTSFREPGKTIAVSSSGCGYTDTFLTCGESVTDMDASTCVGSMVELCSVRTSKRTSTLARSESPQRPKSSLSKSSFTTGEISNRKQRTKSISQSTSQDPRRNPKVSSKTEDDEKLCAKKHQFTSEDEECARYSAILISYVVNIFKPEIFYLTF